MESGVAAATLSGAARRVGNADRVDLELVDVAIGAVRVFCGGGRVLEAATRRAAVGVDATTGALGIGATTDRGFLLFGASTVVVLSSTATVGVSTVGNRVAST